MDEKPHTFLLSDGSVKVLPSSTSIFMDNGTETYVAVWNRVLTDDEMKHLANHPPYYPD